MTSVTPIATARLVVDTDVASFIFKWHPKLAPAYVSLLRGAELVISFMTLAEIREGATNANWGPRRLEVLEDYLAEFAVLHSDSLLCSKWAAVRNRAHEGDVRSVRPTPGSRPRPSFFQFRW